MTYEKFLEEIRKGVEDYMGSGTTVEINHITKNNGIVLDGLTIMEKDKNVSPTIYVNELYDRMAQGEEEENIIKMITRTYEKSKLDHSMDVSFFTDYESVKDKIVYKLVNYDKNEELLKRIPYIRYLDLAIVFYCYFANATLAGASIMIHNNHMEMWQITVDDLYEIAKENTPRIFPCELKSMEEVMQEMFEDSMRRDLKDSVRRMLDDEERSGMTEEWAKDIAAQMIDNIKEENASIPMYVLSNLFKMQGAVCMLYQGILQEFAKREGTDLFILPSSIHEVILVPKNGGEETEKLASMVREVNDTQVGVEEVLSDSVYLYQYKEDKIIQIA